MSHAGRAPTLLVVNDRFSIERARQGVFVRPPGQPFKQEEKVISSSKALLARPQAVQAGWAPLQLARPSEGPRRAGGPTVSSRAHDKAGWVVSRRRSTSLHGVKSMQGQEYRVLHAIRSDEEIARRRPMTWAGWYGQRWRKGLPLSPTRLLQLGKKICQEDFPELVQEDGWEWHVYRALGHTICKFNPEKGSLKVAVEDHFVRCFRFWLKQRLKKKEKQRRKRRFHVREGLDHIPDRASACHNPYWVWGWFLLQKVLPSLDSRARTCISLRAQGMSEQEIANRLKISPKTLSNQYSRKKIVKLVRRKIRAYVLAMAPEELMAFVTNLQDVEELSFAQVSRLLCMDEEELTRLLEVFSPYRQMVYTKKKRNRREVREGG
jgi:DNA-binding CsgD family transcriptional regulator